MAPTLPVLQPPAHVDCTYEFERPNGRLTIEVAFNRPTPASGSAWTRLGAHQCPNCPLRNAEHCPAAADLEPVVEALGDLASVQLLEVLVRHGKRETRQWVTGEAASRAVIGLLMATSACPILGTLRPLATLHLPFATSQESIFRFAAAHLFRQFFAGEPLNLDGLRTQMESLTTVNAAFAARIKAACNNDAIPNAMTALFSLSLIAEDETDMQLASLRELFAEQPGNPPAT